MSTAITPVHAQVHLCMQHPLTRPVQPSFTDAATQTDVLVDSMLDS